MRRGHSYPSAHAALVPTAIDTYETLRRYGLVHDYIAHVRSSQAFALNLLAPLSLAAWTQIARYHLADADAIITEPPEFEYTDPDDTLAEATKASPLTAQVDCLVRTVAAKCADTRSSRQSAAEREDFRTV